MTKQRGKKLALMAKFRKKKTNLDWLWLLSNAEKRKQIWIDCGCYRIENGIKRGWIGLVSVLKKRKL